MTIVFWLISSTQGQRHRHVTNAAAQAPAPRRVLYVRLIVLWSIFVDFSGTMAHALRSDCWAQAMSRLLSPPPKKCCSWYQAHHVLSNSDVWFLLPESLSLFSVLRNIPFHVGASWGKKRKLRGSNEGGNLILPPTSSQGSQDWETGSNTGASHFTSLRLSFSLCKVGTMSKSPSWAPQGIK